MCLGENSANHAVHYLNAQLGSLWENATHCAKRHGTHLKPLERVRYDFALAEYHFGTKQRSKLTSNDDMMFSAVFDKPKVEFICNHEAVLYLKIKSGHLNRDFAKSESTAFVLNRSRNIKLHDIEIALRMDFDVNGIRGHTSKIGNGTHIIQLLVLDFHSAKIVSRVESAGVREALSFYLRKYLDFLHRAGHHVLFSLPDFDDDRLDIIIDYSLNTHTVRNVDYELDEVLGVSVDEINKSLSSKWLKAILDANDGASRDNTCLAEYRSTWTSAGDHADVQFHVKFGAPRIKLLCKREAILYLTIDELLVYDTHDFTVNPKHTFNGWSIAVVVDILQDSHITGKATSVQLDMSTMRYCEHLSIFTGFDLALDFAASLKTTFIEFVNSYTSVLETAHFGSIHTVETHVTLVSGSISSESSESEDDEFEEKDGHWAPVPDDRPRKIVEIVKKTQTHGFDFVQVISHQSIIEHFKVIWQQARETNNEATNILKEWHYAEDFKAKFGPMTIRFLPNGKAIIWIHLEEGSLKPLRGTAMQDFSHWSVAFEINITMIDHEKVASKSWLSRFMSSFAWKQHGNNDQRTLKHLCLDFSNVRFAYELSKFESLSLGNHSAVGYVMGAVKYLKEHYFSLLTGHGHHILQSIPVWKAGSKPPTMGLTDVTFQIYSKYSEHHHSYRLSQASEVSLIILGMTMFRRMSSRRLDYSTDWVNNSKGSVSHGTVCVSKKVFLEERLLNLLSRVNATTTVVPIFSHGENDKECISIFTGREGGEWEVALTTWARRHRQKSQKSQWTLNTGSETDYHWGHSDKLSYEHEGAFDDSNNGIYTAICRTKNELSLPSTAKYGTLDILLKGHIEIDLGFKGTHKSWSVKGTSNWAVDVSMVSLSRGGGISIEVQGDTRPHFETSAVHGKESLKDLINLEALHGILNVDVAELTADLRQSFGGVWEHCFPGTSAYSLCNPIFNRQGDILFELRPYIPPSQQPVAVTKPRAAVNITKKASIVASAPVTEERPQIKKSKSLLKRIGDTIRGVGHEIGDVVSDASEAVQDVFDGSDSDSDATASGKKTKRKDSRASLHRSSTNSSRLSLATPEFDILVKTPKQELPPKVEVIKSSNGHANGGTHTSVYSSETHSKSASQVKLGGAVSMSSTLSTIASPGPAKVEATKKSSDATATTPAV